MIRVLLDTHVLIWLDNESSRLSARARQYLDDPQSLIYVSVVSPWEMSIKEQKGKLELSDIAHRVVFEQVERNNWNLLNVRLHHVRQLSKLDDAHNDPFDRMLAAQAIALGATLLTCDQVFKRYPIITDW